MPPLIDGGFGVVVMREPEEATDSVLLDLRAPRLRAYPREAVVAEKVEAVMRFGMANSCMKDGYDLWLLAQKFDFDGASLSRAIAATFARRHTPLAAGQPLALSREFGTEPQKQMQWQHSSLGGGSRRECQHWTSSLSSCAGFFCRCCRLAWAVKPLLAIGRPAGHERQYLCEGRLGAAKHPRGVSTSTGPGIAPWVEPSKAKAWPDGDARPAADLLPHPGPEFTAECTVERLDSNGNQGQMWTYRARL